MKVIRIIAIILVSAGVALILTCSGGESKSIEMKVESNPSGAEVSLDGKKVGIAPITVVIKGLAKDHQIELAKEGYKSKISTIFISPGHAVDEEYLALTKPDGTWSQVDNNTLKIILEKD